ncbi:hypothetical protein LAZ67_19001718 [Cordylochernes scorpioides]|uniref:Transposase n=1 Tax=Cordylochernes scorpioides TaxID=51811 RepID=A0ABY6LJL2_9ARAC|nr:hypothetical protein LAZ67_19001718 [Cordylochernes scorpioides]
MLTVAYGEASLDRSNVYRWYKMFSEGREDVNDEERARRPSTSTTDEKINEVEKMILVNRRITVREVTEDLNLSIGSCHSIFINDLGMRRVAAKFVPKLLNYDQKQHRMNIANEMLDSVRDDPNLLQRVITGDEAWVHGYDVETKAQSSQWKLPREPRPKKAPQVRSNVKVLLTVFFDCRGVVHHEFLPQGRTVNKEYYLQVMRNLREAIRQKRLDLWKNKIWLLHHDNAPAHTSLLKVYKKYTLGIPKTDTITFPADGTVLAFLGEGEPECLHFSSTELEQLRTPVRVMFTKAFKELETEIKKEVKKADLEKILRRFQTHHEKLLILNMRMEEALLRESVSEDTFTAEYKSVSMNYRLPKLEFKNFGGEPREWISFWSQFSTIDRDSQMPPETKFQYLFQATAQNSEAREAVESFPPSADNYPLVIDYIKSRFGDNQMLVGT